MRDSSGFHQLPDPNAYFCHCQPTRLYAHSTDRTMAQPIQTEGRPVKKLVLTCSLLAALLIGGLATLRPAHAQDATATAASDDEMPQGVTFESLGVGEVSPISADLTNFTMFRLTLAP